MPDVSSASPERSLSADVAIIGCGLVGSVMARCLLAAGARVILVDAGSPMSGVPPAHLRNLAACRADRGFYSELVRAHLRPASVPPLVGPVLGPVVPQMPDGRGINSDQRAKVNMPAARVTNLLGGMGTIWNCVALRPHPRSELWPGISFPEWNGLYDRAEELLGVGLDASQGSHRQDFIVSALASRYRESPRPAPVAARRSAPHVSALRWTGPAEILAGAPADSVIEILPQHAVRRLYHDGNRVLAAEALALETGESRTVSADVFLVAVGGIRTPALLWASGILTQAGETSPLGRHLYDHPVAYAQVVLNPEAVRDAEAWADPDPFVIIPANRDRPFHSLLLCDAYDARILEGRIDDRLIVSLYWYTAMEARFENRIIFSSGSTDAVGLPQPTFEYSLRPSDRELQQAALEDLRAAGQCLGTFLPGSPPQKLSPGSSLHIMGTTLMGSSDEASVVDSYGRVWGFANLYLGGTGLIPGPTATNPTLTACALAIRTADRIIGG